MGGVSAKTNFFSRKKAVIFQVKIPSKMQRSGLEGKFYFCFHVK